MTEREKFEEWADTYRPYYSIDDDMFSAWQACSAEKDKEIVKWQEIAVKSAKYEEDADKCIAKLEAKLAIAIEALDKLSKLGNEPLIGNSIGNDIATEAIAKIKGE